MPVQTSPEPLFSRADKRRKKGKGRFDRTVEQDGRRLRYSEIGRVYQWYRALRISPSYELARRFRAGELPDGAVLPADFEAVLAVFDDLGDVREEIDEWTNGRAFRAFGQGGQKPSTVRLGVIRYGGEADPLASVKDSLDRFAESTWIEQGERTSLVAVIPGGLSRAQMVKQITAMLDNIPPTERDLSPVAPKYRILGNGAVPPSVRKYMSCVERKAAKPDLTLWQIGAAVKLSSTYSGRLDPAAKPDRHQQTDDRIALKILTSRAIHRGHMIAENAARGIFPSYAKCPNAVAIDWAKLGERLA